MNEFRLLLPRRLFDEMLAHARAELPNECVGVMTGLLEEDVARVQRRYSLHNELSSPREYHCQNLFDVHRDMRASGQELLVIYHSHPTSAPIPSRTDLERNNYPTAMHVIISLNGGTPEPRAWWLTDHGYHEAHWEIVDDSSLNPQVPS